MGQKGAAETVVQEEIAKVLEVLCQEDNAEMVAQQETAMVPELMDQEEVVETHKSHFHGKMKDKERY